MKNILFTLALLVSFSSFGQSKKDLKRMYNKLLNDYNELVDNYNKLNEKYNVSFETPDDYGKSLFNLLKTKNKTEANKLFFNVNMLESFPDKLKKYFEEEALDDNVSIEVYLKKWNEQNSKTFDLAYYEGINLGVNWQNSIFQKTEFKVRFEDDIDCFEINNFKVFFKSSNKEYYIKITDAVIINDKPINWELKGPYDIQAEKEKKEQIERERKEKEKQRKIELENKPYKPWGLYLDGENWSYRDKTFSEFRTKIVNETDHYVNRVKFRLSIYTGAKYSGGSKSFSKVYDLTRYSSKGCYGCSSPLKLQPGDVQEIKLPELDNFYLGEDLSNQENWYIKTEVLDVYPKHH